MVRITILYVSLIVYIMSAFSSSAIAQLGLNGSWDLDLKDTQTRHAELNLHQIDGTIFGAGNFILDEMKQNVTVAGSLRPNGLQLYLLNDKGNALIVLHFKSFASRSCKECFEGNYSGFLIDGTKIYGDGTMSKINPDLAKTFALPVVTAGFIEAAQLAESTSSKTTRTGSEMKLEKNHEFANSTN